MKVIDSDNYAASGIEAFFFPGGEPHARIPVNFGPALLFLKARTWNDFGLALCVLDALQNQAPTMAVDTVQCFAAYLPGGRQDRSDGQTPITRDIYLEPLWIACDKLYTFDVHSNTAFGYRYKNFMPSDLLRWSSPTGELAIIAPDAGAKARAQDFADHITNDGGNTGHVEVIQCTKRREFASGNFIGFGMPPLPPAKGYLIVDDICDGGGTFNLLAEQFDKVAPKDARLGLWVSHGIFSKGVRAIHPRIEQIYTTDSWFKETWKRNGDYRLDVVPLQPIIDRIVGSA